MSGFSESVLAYALLLAAASADGRNVEHPVPKLYKRPPGRTMTNISHQGQRRRIINGAKGMKTFNYFS